MHASQYLAAQVVQDVFHGKTLPNALARYHVSLPATIRGFVQELAYGTLRHWGLLSAQIDLLSNKPVSPPLLRYLLAIALYQLQHTRQPSFAVVNQAVDATKKIAPKSASFSNAVLRRFLREQETLTAQAQASSFAARFSYRPWWIRRLQHEYPDRWQSLLDEGNQRPPLTLRVNQRVTTPAALLRRLTDNGIAAKLVGQSGLLLEKAQDVATLPGFIEGEFSVQDLAAQQAAFLLDVHNGMRVLDACAAPGGKTAHLLEIADLSLTALDNDSARLTRVQENLARLKLDAPNVACVVGDASSPNGWWDGLLFDRILADVPCSASGVVRRHPDVKWLRRAADISHFAQTQSAILSALWSLLTPGGYLLYATCSLFHAENERVIASFCAQHPDARRRPVHFPEPLPHTGGQLFPNSDDTQANQDGLYYAMIEKR